MHRRYYFYIGGQYHQPIKIFHALQQVGHFLVGIFVVRIAAHWCVYQTTHRPHQKTKSIVCASALAKSFSRFFSVSPIYFDTTMRKIDAVYFSVSMFSQQGGGKRFSRTRRAIKQYAVTFSEPVLSMPQSFISTWWCCSQPSSSRICCFTSSFSTRSSQPSFVE